MEVYDLGLLRPSILPPAVVTTTKKVLKKDFLKCLLVRKVVDIGLLISATFPYVIVEVVEVMEIVIERTSTVPQVIVEVVKVVQLLPATLNIVIVEDMLIELYLFHNRLSTLPLVIG